jgi:hypothetical protein
VTIPRNDFAHEGRSILNDPDARYDQMREEEEVPVIQHGPDTISIRAFREPHFAIALAGCSHCGAQAGKPCADTDYPEQAVHLAREWAATGEDA